MRTFMRKQLKALMILVMSVLGSLQANALNCSNVDEVAKEAIEFLMLGAGDPRSNPACFEKQTFHYFKPHEVETENDEPTGSKFTSFDPARDKYTFITKRTDDVIEIRAVFTINGQKLRTTYTYQPLDYLQEEVGICGLVYNDFHKILRSDCRAAH
jgi:hypothetical protein